MNLDEAQKQKVARWLEDGLKLSDIQKRLQTEFGLNLTYMELRFLLDDLRLKPKEKEVPPSTISKEPHAASSDRGELPAGDEEEAGELPDPEAVALPPGSSKVGVTVDRIARPGTMVSGGVTFSDGKGAQWYLDQTGRLGIVAKEQGYRPSQPDLLAFQTQLQHELAKLGF